MADRFAGLLAKWYEGQGGSTGQTGQDGGYAQLQKEMEQMLDELGKDMDAGTSDADVARACEGAGDKYQSDNGRIVQDKEICKTLMKALYWMNGRKGGSTATHAVGGAGEEGPKDLKEYLRCIVGYSAMIRLLKNKCEVEKIIETVENAKASAAGGGKEIINEKCKGIKYGDISWGSQILGKPLADWVQKLNSKERMMRLYMGWALCPKKGTWNRGKIEEGKDESKDILQLLREKKAAELHEKVYQQGSSASAPGSSTSQDNILKKVLKEAASCTSGPGNGGMKKCLKEKLELEVAKVCMEDSNNKSFCERLQCAEQHWQLTKEAQQGSGSSKEFWKDSVKEKLDNLFTNTAGGSGGSTSNQCDNVQDLDTANRAACNHMATLLNKMNTTQNGSNDPNELSNQIIKCLLLKAYAEELKKRAKEKGFCSIDEGINEALKTAANGNNALCQWKETEYDSCKINTNGTTNEKVKEEVVKLFPQNTQTKDDGIQKTLANFNENNELCERVKCAAHWWKENNKTGGQNNFWTENGDVKKLWDELSEAIKTKGTAEIGECNTVDGHRIATDPERKACKYLYAGFKQLYEPDTSFSTGNDGILSTKYPPLRQAMGCLLLHDYAKHMKYKAVCDIDKGIEKAFSLWQDPREKAPDNCNGSGKTCIPCKWERNEKKWEECKISTDNTAVQKDVKEKLMDIVKDNDDKIKEMAKDVNNMKFCDRVQCVAARWNKQDKSGKDTVDRTWKKVWEGDDGVRKELKELSEKIETKKEEVKSHCLHLEDNNGKDACILIAAGLKSVYDVNDGNEVEKSFKRTMQCVLLNAIADKMKDDLPCKKERNVENGINEAFGKSATIKNASNDCNNDGDKCFKCERFTDYSSCTIKESGTSGAGTHLKSKIDPKLDAEYKDDNSSLSKSSLTKTICKPCEENKSNKCSRLECIVKKWEERNKTKLKGTASATWDDMKGDFGTELEALLKDMNNTDKQNDVADYCNGGSGAGWEAGAAKEANKTACKMVAAGLQHISKIQESYSGEQQNPYDNQEFKQFASCLMLKAVVQKMKKDSKICDIDIGIRAAFAKAGNIKKDHCRNKTPCIECKLTENYDDCSFDQEKTDNVKDKLNELLTEKGDDVNGTIEDLLKTDQKEASLCSRLQCLASRVQMAHGKNSAEDFWKKEGEVANLWKELSEAMTKTNGTDHTGSGCETMEDGSATGGTPGATPRQGTGPEKRACQHLTLGFNKLKQNPTNGGNYNLLKNPLLRQTVGCFLLKEYAKKMKDTSTCVIDSGLKKAFGSWNSNINVTCNGGKEPCVPCQWNDDSIDQCKINTTNADGSITQTEVTQKLTLVQPKIDETAKENLPKINKMSTLCDYIRCAGPKWFKNKNGTSGNSKHSWCQFWDGAVKDALQNMFNDIAEKGKNNKNAACQGFGDGNEHSVERKACNHITAGLDYINTITGEATTQNGHQDDDKFFKQSMMCAALNLYATKIRKEMENSCPIDETKIEEMFDKWNNKNNKNSSSSPRTPCNGANTNDCFVCTRQKEDFNNCNLLLDQDLIGTSTPPGASTTCNDNDDKNNKNVPQKMDELLEKEPKMEPTLEKINEMKSSFCTQLQCAAKKYYVNVINKKGQSSDVNWNALKTEIVTELTALLNNMNDATKQKEVEQYCKNDTNWNNKGHTERRTNRAACLHFASGLKHIYTHGNGRVNGPSFGQTMGCLFLKEYAKQLQKVANDKKRGNSWVHPLCDIDEGINYAFNESKKIMEETSPCKDTNGTNDCFVCIQKEDDYNNCKIGDDNIGNKAKDLFKNESKQKLMQQTLENTVCPILITDLLTPFLPLAPVSIGLSAMAYYLWKYFGPLGKGGPRFRRSPAEIRGPSVQEQVLDHVEEAGPHEYQLVKERKPRSTPTRTKRSGPVNRRTIIEIHFEVLDECQKGDTQLNQKDFLELLVQEFMGSEFMEEEQVPKEEVLMEGVPMESIPMERVPSLGSVFMV
ncbi:SICAvar, type I [Plasmodium knowlesi strain H]|uniref:SICAvar, type I n=3 Tax=Plasmodium knowlesi TaxID=5850 RepID=A0A5E7X294_PLAKH|nr:SICAvar, type I [Plasmodium knowlesi strain H]OTN64399.1 SICAvar type I [Plasmodium knowlesi]CAA9989211.1 SICAvar, type I [Plasmodium knowlesi strain H]SBO27238.1 SICAvar, type I [Plasmodium knowlesi strain H]SBO27435.1 SICAvar, type I [Plasmodium knowlesi strain H]VVS78685.1 SICAvar, type I [Plasmodium knowlesi strain H]